MELTKKETLVLQDLASGKTVPIIAKYRFNSEHTIKAHIKNIHVKLSAKTNAQAVFIAIKHCLIKIIFVGLMVAQGLPVFLKNSDMPDDSQRRLRAARSFRVRAGRVKHDWV